MIPEKTFRAKIGFCHILPDRIVLTRYGITEGVSNETGRDPIVQTLIIYGLLSLFLFYSAYDAYQKGFVSASIVSGLIGLFFIYVVLSGFNLSAVRVIQRDKIKSVQLKKGVIGLTRSRFVVRFENEQGKIKKRLIMLPGSLTGGAAETKKAIKIMAEEGLITES